MELPDDIFGVAGWQVWRCRMVDGVLPEGIQGVAGWQIWRCRMVSLALTDGRHGVTGWQVGVALPEDMDKY